jgi:hypothetical protein
MVLNVGDLGRLSVFISFLVSCLFFLVLDSFSFPFWTSGSPTVEDICLGQKSENWPSYHEGTSSEVPNKAASAGDRLNARGKATLKSSLGALVVAEWGSEAGVLDWKAVEGVVDKKVGYLTDLCVPG